MVSCKLCSRCVKSLIILSIHVIDKIYFPNLLFPLTLRQNVRSLLILMKIRIEASCMYWIITNYFYEHITIFISMEIFFHSYEWMYKSIIHIEWSKRIRKSRLIINILHEAPLVLSTVHAHLSDKLSELYHILRRIQTWIHVRGVAYNTCQEQPQESTGG